MLLCAVKMVKLQEKQKDVIVDGVILVVLEVMQI